MEGRLSGADRSLNAPMSEQDGDGTSIEWQDILVCDGPLPDETVSDKNDGSVRKAWIHDAMETLTDREPQIITERRLGDGNVTLESLGKKLGISKERVRQIEHQALEKLRQALLQITNGDPAGAGLIP